MVSHPHRLQSGHITCYLNRTYHVLPTATASTVADLAALPYPALMSNLEHMMPTLMLKRPPTAEIEKAIADGLSKLVGGEGIFGVRISSLEWHNFDLKVSLTVEPAFRTRADEEDQVAQPASV